MGDVIILPVIGLERDGGKARIKRCQPMLADRRYGASQMPRDLIMDQADPADTSPCELCGQVGDCA